MPKLKVGIIGGGGISQAHLPHLQAHPEVELVALADVNPAAAALQEQYGIAQFVTDYRELLPLVDAVLICVPTHLHAPVAVAALRAEKAVFCEKPLARTLAEATEIGQAARKSGAPLQVGFVRRFDEEWLAWREIILQEKIGRPVVWRDVMAGGAPGGWFVRDEQGGGPFLDGCIHNFDFGLHTFGPVKWVFCHGRTLSPQATAIETGTATIRFESDDELMLAWSWGLPKGCSGTRVFEFLGPEGTVTWPRLRPGGPVSEREGAQFVVSNGTTQDATSFSPNALGEAFALQMDEFVAVARREKTPRAGLSEGIQALRVSLAVIESARTHSIIRL